MSHGGSLLGMVGGVLINKGCRLKRKTYAREGFRRSRASDTRFSAKPRFGYHSTPVQSLDGGGEFINQHQGLNCWLFLFLSRQDRHHRNNIYDNVNASTQQTTKLDNMFLCITHVQQKVAINKFYETCVMSHAKNQQFRCIHICHCINLVNSLRNIPHTS